jgi:uncharacterized protein YbaA (DUF1428 family)
MPFAGLNCSTNQSQPATRSVLMPRYVDGFVFAVPKNKVEEYRKVARKAGKVWREHGALEYIECIGDDVPKGKVTDFAMSVKAKRNEVVGFAWIVYRSRKHRDAVNKKVMSDPRLANYDPKDMPADMSRMIYGGFKAIVEL